VNTLRPGLARPGRIRPPALGASLGQATQPRKKLTRLHREGDEKPVRHLSLGVRTGVRCPSAGASYVEVDAGETRRGAGTSSRFRRSPARRRQKGHFTNLITARRTSWASVQGSRARGFGGLHHRPGGGPVALGHLYAGPGPRCGDGTDADRLARGKTWLGRPSAALGRQVDLAEQPHS